MLSPADVVDVTYDGHTVRYRVFSACPTMPDQRDRFALRAVHRPSGPLTRVAYHGDGEWTVEVLGGHQRCQVKEVG